MLALSTIYSFYGASVSIYLYGRKTLELAEEMKHPEKFHQQIEQSDYKEDNLSDIASDI
jgi:hypothetical protein